MMMLLIERSECDDDNVTDKSMMMMMLVIKRSKYDDDVTDRKFRI